MFGLGGHHGHVFLLFFCDLQVFMQKSHFLSGVKIIMVGYIIILTPLKKCDFCMNTCKSQKKQKNMPMAAILWAGCFRIKRIS